MSEDPNPFSTPSSINDLPRSPAESTEPKVTARSILLTWEKWLRPVYNLVLFAVASSALLHFANRGFPVPLNSHTVIYFLSQAIAANILFTAGPLVDVYITVLLDKRFAIVPGIIFTLGTLLSIPLVLFSMISFWYTEYPELKF